MRAFAYQKKLVRKVSDEFLLFNIKHNPFGLLF